MKLTPEQAHLMEDPAVKQLVAAERFDAIEEMKVLVDQVSKESLTAKADREAIEKSLAAEVEKSAALARDRAQLQDELSKEIQEHAATKEKLKSATDILDMAGKMEAAAAPALVVVPDAPAPEAAPAAPTPSDGHESPHP